MKYLLSILLLLLITNCSSTKINSKTALFSKGERALILSDSVTKPMRVLLITNAKDSMVLRSKSTAIKPNIDNKTLRHFTKRLYATVRDSATRGVGIAAPQVGILKKIIWIQRFDKEDKPFEVYFNPEIKKYSEMKQDVMEGCLSIPGIRGNPGMRAYAIFLVYDDRKGKQKCEMVEAFTAVIFQHEIDHLSGIMFTDHLKKETKKSIKHGL